MDHLSDRQLRKDLMVADKRNPGIPKGNKGEINVTDFMSLLYYELWGFIHGISD